MKVFPTLTIPLSFLLLEVLQQLLFIRFLKALLLFHPFSLECFLGGLMHQEPLFDVQQPHSIGSIRSFHRWIQAISLIFVCSSRVFMFPCMTFHYC